MNMDPEEHVGAMEDSEIDQLLLAASQDYEAASSRETEEDGSSPNHREIHRFRLLPPQLWKRLESLECRRRLVGGRLGLESKSSELLPFCPREISVLTELALGHLRYRLTDVPPQPNSPPDTVIDSDRPRRRGP